MTTIHDLTAPAGLAEETRRNHPLALEALRNAVRRNARMWRRISDFGVPVPGLTWTAAETAAHMIGDLYDYADVLTRYAKGYVTHPMPRTGSPSALSAAANARHLAEVPERNMHRLSRQLEAAADAYLSVAGLVDVDTAVPTPNGLVIDASVITGLLLSEQLIHGFDIGRATDRLWTIGADEALLAIPAVLTVAPEYLRPDQARRPVSFELRMRGGRDYRFAVINGSATVGAAGAPVDCTITAEPVAFLMAGFGRIPSRSMVLRGKLRPGGRRPWRTMTFGSLLASP